MKEYIFSNGLKLVYKKRETNLTSICISINAGADMEDNLYGLAHATEHMVYKATKNRNEIKINEDLTKVFGFNNAMTNYPYVIYYGTLLEEDFSKGIEILGDIIINPIFPEKGFIEEINVIKEELKEWDEDLEQFVEDKQFFNTFEDRRIKYPIIGRMEDLEKITLKDIKNFYKSYYLPGNATISVVSNIELDEAKFAIWKVFKEWEASKNVTIKKPEYGEFKSGLYRDYREGINGAKIQIIFKIDHLTEDEMKGLRVFNEFFSNGINSVLYTKLRTEKGIIYDVIPKIAHEKSIKLYKIILGTGTENVNLAVETINEAIREIHSLLDSLDKEKISELIKSMSLKKLFREEQGIVLAKEISTYDTMHESYKTYLNENIDLDFIDKEYLKELAIKIFENKSIQIIEKK
ncbi:MAG: M16 family metallopeptidase [Clostridium sp.]|uniref:M16 family metallopeptidase n=1 Tax=Clostridium sp. TaxID=1506 RepID=UPI003F3B8F94